MIIKNVCVVGCGRMGCQIAMNTAMRSNMFVTITDSFENARESAKSWIEDYLKGRIEKGRLTEDQVADIKNRFKVMDTLEEAARDADLVIEAVTEIEEIKKSLFSELDKIVRKDTILATNSSSMASSNFKDCISNPERLANLHYFNPAIVMKLTEIVKGEHTSEETVQALADFAKETGKDTIIIRKELERFVVNRILLAIQTEAFNLVENGYCTCADIDKACLEGLGHKMGPFRMLDLAGVDLAYQYRKTTFEKTGIKLSGYDTCKKMVENNELGEKTGKGFYDYRK